MQAPNAATVIFYSCADRPGGGCDRGGAGERATTPPTLRTPTDWAPQSCDPVGQGRSAARRPQRDSSATLLCDLLTRSRAAPHPTRCGSLVTCHFLQCFWAEPVFRMNR